MVMSDIAKQNEAAGVSVALHERDETPWEYKPEITARYDSQTGEKKEDVSHWIYSGPKHLCLVANREDAAETSKRIAKCVNLHEELTLMLASLHFDFFNEINDETKDKIEALLKKANSL